MGNNNKARSPRIHSISVSALLLLLLIVCASATQSNAQQPDQRCFPETGHCIAGRIREYWEQNGGLPIFGYPIGPQQGETVEGTLRPVQWFERNRLELHGTIQIWDTATWQPHQTIEPEAPRTTDTLYHPARVTSVAYSPDGRVLVGGYVDGTMRLWDTSTYAPLHTMREHRDRVVRLAFLADGALILSSSNDRTVRVWGIP
jgi:hypothetical protein